MVCCLCAEQQIAQQCSKFRHAKTAYEQETLELACDLELCEARLSQSGNICPLCSPDGERTSI